MNFLKAFTINTLIILLFVFVLGIVGDFVLNSFTRHGMSLTLPNLKSLSFNEVERILQQKKLRYLITDTAFVDNMPKGSVVEQNPAPNTKVKEGRIIYLTLNSSSEIGVEIPNLINSSLRYAEMVLLGLGLKLGTITEHPDIAQGAVLDMQYRNRSIQPGIKVPKGSSIDFVVGNGMGGSNVSIPDLTGLTLFEAKKVLESNMLLLGKVIFEGNGKDTSLAIVRKQSPAYDEELSIRSGESIDIFLGQ